MLRTYRAGLLCHTCQRQAERDYRVAAGDVDLKKVTLSITKSRYRDTGSPMKTVVNERKIAMGELIIAALRSIKPLHVSENDFVFKNQGR